MQSWIFSIITPVFSVALSSRNHSNNAKECMDTIIVRYCKICSYWNTTRDVVMCANRTNIRKWEPTHQVTRHAVCSLQFFY